MLPKGPKIEFEHEASLDWSVVVPVHRNRKGLKRCLDSMLHQLKPGMELIVADHAGITGFNFQKEVNEQKIRWSHVEPTGAMFSDWNRAVSLCRGRWIHLLHDDDWVSPRFYETLEEELQGCAIGTTGYQNVKMEEGSKEDETIAKITFTRPKFEVPIWPGLAMTNQFQPSAVVVARSTYDVFGGYIDMPHCPDWEFYARVSEAGGKWALVEEILCTHTEGSEECESAAPWTEQINGYRRLLEYFYARGIQRDALAAGVGNMLSVAMKKAVAAAADISEDKLLEEDSSALPLFGLAVELERQKRRYLA